MKRRKPFEPWAPPSPTYADVLALKALEAGTANDGQQKRALKFIVENICGYYEEQFCPDSQRATDYALGKRRVASAIVSILKANAERFKDQTGEPNA